MIRAVLAAVLFSLASVANASDFTDLWWNPSESGWGVSVTQQGNTIFALWFVYGADGSPTWYVMPDGVGLNDVFTGDLYQTNGPAFSAATFDPSKVGSTKVGTARLDFSGGDGKAAVSYTVNGTTIDKTIQRQSFGSGELAGTYGLGVAMSRSGCFYAPNNAIVGFLFSLQTPFDTGPPQTDFRVDASNNVTITQSDVFQAGSECTGKGVLSGNGRLMTITGTYDCGSRKGNFTMDQIAVNRVTAPPVNGFSHSMKTLTGTFTAQDTSGETCRTVGAFGAMAGG